MKKRLITLLITIVSVSCCLNVSGQIVSTFDQGPEDWLVVQVQGGYNLPVSGGIIPNWSNSTGNPGGGIDISDIYAETFFSAPSPFLGDQSAAFNTNLRFDILIQYTDNTPYPAVILNGETKNLYYNIPPSPLGVWTTRSIPLVGTGWKLNSWQGLAATNDDMMEVLSTLQGLYINAEWKTGPDSTTLDNVILDGSVPFCGDTLHPYPDGDLSQDCRVNLVDFSLISAGWQSTYFMTDMLDLANNWLSCNNPSGCP